MKNIVLKLLGINIAVFLLQIVLGSWFTEVFLLDSSRVLYEPWRLVTSMFLHGDVNHILFNMYGLFLFGSLLEPRIGSKKFFWTYMITGIVAGLASSAFYPRSLGASGALMGIIGLTIIVMPQLRLLFFFVIPMPLWVAGIVWAAIDTVGIFIPSGVANVAHLAGLGAGLLYGLYAKKKGTLLSPVNFRFGGFTRKKKKEQPAYSYSSKLELSEDDIDEYLRTGKL